jgi:hypothetical protein
MSVHRVDPFWAAAKRPVELACTVAIDTPEAGGSWLMAMMLAMSVVRSQFDGDVVIFWSGEVPVRTVGSSDAAAWCVTECGECDARIHPQGSPTCVDETTCCM